MNPQYVPQAQFGAPPQGFPPVKPGPGVSMPPTGLQDSFPGNNNPPQQAPGGYMQPQQSYGYKGPMGPPGGQNSMMPPPSNQMQQPGPPLMQQPPMGQHPQRQQVGPPPSFNSQRSSPVMGRQNQNGLVSNQGLPSGQSSPQRQMGTSPGHMPPSQMGAPSIQKPLGPPGMGPSGNVGPPYLAVCPPHPGYMNPPHSSAASMGMPPGPPQMSSISNQGPGAPPTLMPQPSSMGPPPTSMGQPSMGPPPTSMGQPSMGPPPTSMGQPSMGPPPTSMGQPLMGPPPTSMGQPSMGPPPTSMGPPSMGPPPTSMGQPSMGPPPTSMGQPSMGPPTSMGPAPMSMGQPPMSMGQPLMEPPPMSMGQPSMGLPPTSMGQPSMGPPPTSMGQPPTSMGQPPTSMGQPSMRPPPTSMRQPSMGPSPTSMGQLGGPPTSAGNYMDTPSLPSGMLGTLPSSTVGPIGAPPMGPPISSTTPFQGNTPSRPGQGNFPPGPPGGQMGIPPTIMHTKSPLMPPLSSGAPPQMNAMGPPLMGGAPRGNIMPGLPPGPGQFSNKMGAPGQFQNMPPPIGETMNSNYGPNQLSNQMNDINLAGNRQYPGGPMNSTVNGDNSMNSPHMPPPLNQQNQGQYINGQQSRGPPQQPMGYPPMPGQQGATPGGPYSQQQYQQLQQGRRLDPNHMPSPIQVILDDQKTRSGIFYTNQKGLVPPLVSTNFITQDQGNAGPRYIRSTMYNVPTTADMMKQTAVPFGLIISPLARTLDQEYPPPIVDFGEMGPVRCIRCKAYMSPFMQFIDSGRRFQCLFCKATTEVPAEYFQHLDHTGQRVDRYERPELILGAYEFVATKDYCRNNTFPKPPAIVFVIDVSYNNVKSGLVHLLCTEMKEILKHLPIDQGQEKSKMKVGFITYNSTVHFYNIKGNLAQPQMLVVGDTQEMFMPLLDGFLCDIEDSAAVIDSLMTQIPAMFGETRETETVLLPAIQAGLEALKASECTGKLLVFHSTLPIAEAPGKLKNRDERKLLGTEKERTVLTPQTQAYNQLGQDCVAAGCCVDLFITNNSYIDLATIGQVCRLTGGEMFKYTYFQADIDGHRIVNDIITNINRPVVFDSIMRVRTSTGVRPTDFYGHFYMSNTTDMEIAAIDCDKAVTIEIKHDDKLTEEEGVYIQVALLFTSCSGQRRLRILNLSLKTCSQMADLYRSCELDTVVNFFSKQSVYKLLENNPKAVKDSLVNRCAQMLACYRKNCASPSSAGQLILPECMKLLPLYVNCLLKSDAISGGSDMTLDDRSFVMQCVITMDVPTSAVYFYPRLVPLHEIQNGSETPEVPTAVRCTVEKMVDNGVYLLENGIHMLIWIGSNADAEWIQSVFGSPSAGQVDTDHVSLPELDTTLSVAVRNLVDQIRAQRHRWMRLTLVKQRDKLETVFRHFLMEDRGQDGSSSYIDFLCHMHKEIRQLLS